jgi:hypothetical protein
MNFVVSKIICKFGHFCNQTVSFFYKKVMFETINV